MRTKSFYLSARGEVLCPACWEKVAGPEDYVAESKRAKSFVAMCIHPVCSVCGAWCYKKKED